MLVSSEDAAHPHSNSHLLRTWLAALSDVARGVNAAEPMAAMLTRIAEHACALIGFDFCAVMLADSNEKRMTAAGWSGLTSDYITLVSDHRGLVVQPMDSEQDSPAARAFREGRVISVANVAAADEYGRLEALAPAQGYESLIAAPMRGEIRTLGVVVGYRQRPHRYTHEELEFVELLAEQTAIVIQNAELRSRQQEIITELSTTNSELNEQRANLEWAEVQHRSLMDLVLADIGLTELVHNLADVLTASVTVEDGTGLHLAQAPVDNHAPPPGSKVRRLDARFTEKYPSRGYEVLEVRVDGGSSWLAPVVLSGVTVARLWITGRTDRLDAGEKRLIERFAHLVGVELLKRRHTAEIRERLSGDLLSDMFRPGGLTQPEATIARAQALGHDLRAPHWIVLLHPMRGAEASGDDLQLLARVAGETDPELLAGVHDNTIALVVPAHHDPEVAASRLSKRYFTQTRNRSMTTVLGSLVHEPADYPDAYRLADAAAKLGEYTGHPGVIDLRELDAAGLLLLAGTPPEALRRFASRLIGPLADHDRLRDGNLVDTLRHWLRLGCSTSAAAAEMIVHTNTVNYRLGRIEKLVRRDLRRTDTRLNLQLAVYVWDIMQLQLAAAQD